MVDLQPMTAVLQWEREDNEQHRQSHMRAGLADHWIHKCSWSFSRREYSTPLKTADLLRWF
jgi:hypothetical protein